jgi:hypothetical protein
VCRLNGNDVDAASFDAGRTFAPGDTVTIAPKRRYRIIDVTPAEPPFHAVWIVEALWHP